MLKRYLLLLAAIVALSGCDHWIEKLEPQETGFARHCFDLLQRHDYAAIEDMAGPALRSGDFASQLADMAAMIPAEAPISSDAVSVNVSTTNGYTKSSVGLVYQYPSGWLQFDIASEGSGDARTLTWIRLQPTAPRGAEMAYLPLLAALPAVVIVLALIGTVIYRRRVERRETLRTTPEERARRDRWSMAIDATANPWFYRLIGIRRIALTSAFDPEECRRRLASSIERESILFRLREPQQSEYEGVVRRSTFRITRKRSVVFSNHYQTFLYGRLAPDGAGTRVRCSFGPQRLVLGLAAAFLAFAWVMFPVVGTFQDGFRTFDAVFMLPPVLVTGFMAAASLMNRKRMLADSVYLLDFVAQTIEAREAPTVKSRSIERAVSR